MTVAIAKQAVAFRVIADHIRAIAFTIADGQFPSNTGAGYVIQKNSYEEQFVIIILIWIINNHCCINWCPLLAKQFENVFPELYKQQDFVTKVVKEEEEAFLRTLGKRVEKN